MDININSEGRFCINGEDYRQLPIKDYSVAVYLLKKALNNLRKEIPNEK